MQTTTYSNADLVRLVSDLSSELENTKNEIARLKINTPKQTAAVASAAKEFTKVDPRVVVYNPSGTNGDGSYQAVSTVDFSSAVASGAKLVYIYVAIAVDDPGEVAPGWGFTWKPTGWTDTLEKFTRLTVDTAIEDKNIHALPLSDALTVDIAVYKPDNGVGDAWSYSFEVWGYE